MKKGLLAILLLAGFLFAVGAEGQGEKNVTSGSGKTEITFYTFSAAPDHLEDLNNMIAIFEEQNKDVKVTVESVGWDDYFNKLQVNIVGGLAPDVFELNYENFVSYAAKGALYNLNELAAADPDYSPSVFYNKALSAFSYQGVQYALPETFSTVVLFYNKDLFDAAGVAYPTEDWTWDDAIAAAEKIRDPENDIWGLNSPVQFWEFYKKVAQNGGSIYDADGNPVINSPENVQALQTMLDIQSTYDIMPGAADMGGMDDSAMFKAGKIGMIVTGIWMFDSFKDADFDWDIQVEPGMAEKATHYFANGLAISKDTAHADAAWRWAKFLSSSPEAAKIRIESGWELPAISDQSAVVEYLSMGHPANRQAVFDSLKYAVVPPVIERQSELQDGVGQLLEKASLGMITAQEALDQAQQLLESLK